MFAGTGPTPSGSLISPAASSRKGGELPQALKLAVAKLMAAASSTGGDADLSELKLGRFPLDKFSDLPTLITGLRSLDLSKTALVDLPVAIGSLSKLQNLILEDNKLAALPIELHQLKSLEILDVRSNRLSEFPLCLRGMVALKALQLDDNPKIGSVPDWLPESCPAVTELSVEACGLTSFPPVLARLRALRKLRLSRNKGMLLPTTLVDGQSGRLLLEKLEELSLGSLGLEDEGIVCLRQLKRLKRVNLRDNALVSLPPFVAELPGLVELDVSTEFVHEILRCRFAFLLFQRWFLLILAYCMLEQTLVGLSSTRWRKS
jgi:Leucine-rich repeat (LRR) protein